VFYKKCPIKRFGRLPSIDNSQHIKFKVIDYYNRATTKSKGT